MLQAIATTITVCSVLVHALTGCCWHHGHEHSAAMGCDRAAQAVCVHDHAAHAEHGHHHAGAAADPEYDDEPLHVPCGDPRCEFVATSHGPSIALQLQWFDSSLATFSAVSTTGEASLVEAVDVRFKPTLSAPVEHCALTQVWRL